MTLRGGPLALVGHKTTHHGAHSGYMPLAEHLTFGRRIDGTAPFLPWRIRRMLRRSPSELYTSDSVTKELQLLKMMAGRRPGVAHFFNGERDFYYTGFTSRLAGWHTVGSFHKTPARLHELIHDGRYLRKLDVAVCLATSQMDEVRTLVGHDRVRHIPHGIDTAFFTPRESDVPPQRRQLLIVGHYQRDFELLGHVLQQLKVRYPALRCSAVVGKRWAGLVPKFEWLHVESGISDVDLRERYRDASALLLPLSDAAANCAIGEAMACGLPVITTDVGGVRDYVDETMALLSPAKSTDAMVDNASTFLDDIDLQARMRTRAREKALNFSWPLIAQRMVDLYKVEFGIDVTRAVGQ